MTIDRNPERARGTPFVTLVKQLARALPANASVGGLGPVRDETIRFVHDVRPVFHTSDVIDLQIVTREGRAIAKVTTSFLGLVGAASPLAHYFTADVLRTDADDDPTLRNFYDLFHHRLVSLLFRVHLRSTPAAEIRVAGDDAVTRRSLAATGVSSRPPLAPRAWLACARVLGRRPRTRDALEAALAESCPELGVRVTDFLPRDGRRQTVKAPRLGRDPVILGRGLRLGRQVRAAAGLVRLTVGPVRRDAYEALRPGGGLHARLQALVHSVLSEALDVELEVELAPSAAPRATLGARYGTRLGVNAVAQRPEGGGAVRARISLTGGGGPDVRPVFLVSRP